VEIMIVECRDDRDYEAALAKMVEGGADATILGAFALPNLDKVVPLAALHKLPAIYPGQAFARAGGLMSYDTEPIDLSRRLGSYYVARILRGDKPTDLPVEQPTRFRLVINFEDCEGNRDRSAPNGFCCAAARRKWCATGLNRSRGRVPLARVS
jgi:putative ABC transport system substrate-binding protein